MLLLPVVPIKNKFPLVLEPLVLPEVVLVDVLTEEELLVLTLELLDIDSDVL